MTLYITEECNGCTSCAVICPTGAIAGKKKKQHSINADYCIECGVCGKICPAGAVEDAFGQVATRVKRKMWEKPVFDTKKCTACVICIDACPIGCIVASKPEKKGSEGYPELINEKVCLGCGFCEDECPVEAITMVVPEQSQV